MASLIHCIRECDIIKENIQSEHPHFQYIFYPNIPLSTPANNGSIDSDMLKSYVNAVRFNNGISKKEQVLDIAKFFNDLLHMGMSKQSKKLFQITMGSYSYDVKTQNGQMFEDEHVSRTFLVQDAPRYLALNIIGNTDSKVMPRCSKDIDEFKMFPFINTTYRIISAIKCNHAGRILNHFACMIRKNNGWILIDCDTSEECEFSWKGVVFVILEKLEGY